MYIYFIGPQPSFYATASRSKRTPEQAEQAKWWKWNFPYRKSDLVLMMMMMIE